MPLRLKGERRTAAVIGSTVHVMRARGFSFETSPAISPSPLNIGDYMAKKRKRVAWSAEQVRTLKSMAKKKAAAQRIAKKLKRTEGATRQKAFSMGLSLDSRG